MKINAIVIIICFLSLFPNNSTFSFNCDSKLNLNKCCFQVNLEKGDLSQKNLPIGSAYNTDSLSTFLKLQSLAFNIDSLDTVIFDLSKAMMVGSFIEFPVTFHADDFIYALDFSLKYNNQNIEFDSLINLTTGLNYLYYLNPNDSTLRFTSYRLGQMQNDTAVLKLRFTTLNGSVCINDLNTITGYLNGDQCSYKVTDCDTISTQTANIQGKDAIAMYPNPANQFLYLKISENYSLHITDVTGNIVFISQNTGNNSGEQFDVSLLSNGMYYLKITTPSFSIVEKLLIQR